ncbi:restriction endonuclease [Polynucleobacter sp. JS-Fieb-80-E5]|uniref:restriction endonuclease n=1 Tax=Polynucleobacter sp. JS-Fieb-80-E5 TaxID=2081050 RepID=UPI001C0D067A|nr:restriction endonuclease [Polynucleobacter sp. JS-Fieb-80-E5]MBU3617622.1 restriction endonuclease [Polynucleobacter sp. JS-Fieb-80-E5]
MTSKIFTFNEIASADLVIDALYEGGKSGNTSDDPITKLMSCGNQGGFRFTGSFSAAKFCVLYTELSNREWPDYIDFERGQFVYYGDNRTAGHELHDTVKKGNLILKNAFDNLHIGKRGLIPPFFIFSKAPGAGRSVIFRGLAVPGARDISQTEDLHAIWKTSKAQRFQNYRATFTILDEPVILRQWVNELLGGTSSNSFAPPSYIKWKDSGKYTPLLAPPSVLHRTVDQQLPQNQIEEKFIEKIKNYFESHTNGEYAFEKCAILLAQIMDKNIISCDNTRPWKDGGRDAIGVYRIGTRSSYSDVEFALEAKCYKLSNGCGVRETSRLISRLRHRQFGIFITTSYVALQAYQEIIEDGHPVLVLAATDIAKILIDNGISDEAELSRWLLQF